MDRLMTKRRYVGNIQCDSFFFVSPGRAKLPSNSRAQTTLEKNDMLLNFPIHAGTQHREGRQPLRGCWCEVPGALMDACDGTSSDSCNNYRDG